MSKLRRTWLTALAALLLSVFVGLCCIVTVGRAESVGIVFKEGEIGRAHV